MHKQTEEEFLEEVLLGNRDAIEFIDLIGQITQDWDDLYDEGAEPGHEKVNELMWAALVQLPVNPFYQRHFATLYPLVRQMIVDWFDANRLQEYGDEHALHIAFVLRDSSAGLLTTCAGLVGGYDHMRRVGPVIRAFCMDEPFEEFKEEHESREQTQEAGADG